LQLSKTLLEPVDGIAIVGDTVRFQIVLENIGPTSITALPLTDVYFGQCLSYRNASPAPDNVLPAQQQLLWYNLGPLAAGQRRTVTVELSAEAACDSARNAAGVTNAVDEFGSPVTALLEDAYLHIAAPAELAAEKRDVLWIDGDGDGRPSPGDTLRYEVIIRNEGSSLATGVRFEDTPGVYTTLLAGSVQTSQGTVSSGNLAGDSNVVVQVGDIRGGGSVTVSFQVQIDEALPAGVDTVANQGLISSNELPGLPTDDPDVPGTTDPTTTPLPGSGQLEALKSVRDLNGGNVKPGDVLQYTVVLRDSSGYTVGGAQFLDEIPAHTSYVAGSLTAPAGSTVVSEAPTLRVTGISVPSHGQVSITFRVQVDDPLAAGVAEIRNQGTISYDSDGDGSNETTQATDGDTTQPGEQPTVAPVTAGPNFDQTSKDVSLVSHADPEGVVSPGDVLRYTVVIRNSGDQDSTGTVLFQDSVPAFTSYVDGSATASSGSVSFDAANERIEWSGHVPAGGSVTITFDITADSGLVTGTVLSNQGTVFYDSDGDGDNDSSEPTDGDLSEPGNQPTEVVVGGQPQGVAMKSVEDLNGGNVKPGDELLYTVVMQNLSGLNVHGIEFVDSMPAHTTYVAGSLTAPVGSTVVSEAPTLRITGIDVPAHSTVLLIFRVQVDNPLAAGVAEIRNQGTVFYDSDGDGSNDATLATDGDTTLPGEQPTVAAVTAGPNFDQTSKDVSLVFDADPEGVVSPGDVLRFTVVIHNSGDQDSTGTVLFQDSVPAFTSYVDGSAMASTGNVVFDAANNRVQWSGDVPAGGSVTITFEVTVDSGLVTGTVLSNQGTVFYDSDGDGDNDSSEPTDGDLSEPGDQPTDSVVGGRPEGVAMKSVEDLNGGNVQPGDELLYTVVMQNQSGLSVYGIEFVDSMPAHVTYVAGSLTAPAGSTVVSEAPTLRITGIDVPAFSTVELSFRARLNDSLPSGLTTLINQGTVFYDSDGDGNNDTTQPTDGDTVTPGWQPAIVPVVVTSGLEVSKRDVLFGDRDQDGVVSPGDVLRYEMVITNGGNVAATDVHFSDTPGAYTSLVVGSVESSQGTVLHGNDSGDTTVAVDVGTLPAGASATVSFQEIIDDPLPAGLELVSNQAQVSSGNLPPALSDDPDSSDDGDPTITPVTVVPRLEILKTASQEWVHRYEDLTFVIVVRNDGHAPAQDVVVTDQISELLTFVRVQISRGTAVWNSGTRVVTARVEDLEPGESVTMTITAQVLNIPAADLPAEIANVAVVDYRDGPGPEHSNETMTDVVHFGPGEIPEPSTMLLLASGLLGLAAYAGARRRR
jgi:uncharacterized repeat protein (TIGR01451 family)